MDIKFLIFGIISGLFAAVLYGSSPVHAVDEVTTDCSYTKTKKTAFCSTSDSEDVWRCDKQKNGTWKCDKLARESSSLPPDLTDALTIATENAQNDTKVPKDFASREGALLKDDSQITTNGENSPTPPKCPDKGPIPPNCTIDPFLK